MNFKTVLIVIYSVFFFISCSAKTVIDNDNDKHYADSLQRWVGQHILQLNTNPEFLTVSPDVYTGTHTTVYVFNIDFPKIVFNVDGTITSKHQYRIVVIQTNRLGKIKKIDVIHKD